MYNQIRDLLRHSSHRLQLDSMPSSFSNHIDCIKSKLNLSEQELQSIEELSNYLKELPRGGSKCNQIVNPRREQFAGRRLQRYCYLHSLATNFRYPQDSTQS